MHKKIITALLFIMLASVIVYSLSKKLQNKQGEHISPSSIPASVNSPQMIPAIASPLPYSKVISPLTVRGVVPAGWMFEGVFPVKLLDSKRKIIAQTSAKETSPGSWNSGTAVNFTGVLTFSTKEKTGFLVIEKDNPSGLPEKDASFEIPVGF